MYSYIDFQSENSSREGFMKYFFTNFNEQNLIIDGLKWFKEGAASILKSRKLTAVMFKTSLGSEIIIL